MEKRKMELLTILNSKPYGFNPFKAEKMAEWIFKNWDKDRLLAFIGINELRYSYITMPMLIALIKDKLTTNYHTHAVARKNYQCVHCGGLKDSGHTSDCGNTGNGFTVELHQPILLTSKHLCTGDEPTCCGGIGHELGCQNEKKYQEATKQVIFEGNWEKDKIADTVFKDKDGNQIVFEKDYAWYNQRYCIKRDNCTVDHFHRETGCEYNNNFLENKLLK